MGRFRRHRGSYVRQALFILLATLNALVAVGAMILGEGWSIFTGSVWALTLSLMAWVEVRDRRLEDWRRARTISINFDGGSTRLTDAQLERLRAKVRGN